MVNRTQEKEATVAEEKAGHPRAVGEVCRAHGGLRRRTAMGLYPRSRSTSLGAMMPRGRGGGGGSRKGGAASAIKGGRGWRRGGAGAEVALPLPCFW